LQFLLSYREIKDQMLRIQAKQQRLQEQADNGPNTDDLQQQSDDLKKYYQQWESVLERYEGTRNAAEQKSADDLKKHLENQLNKLTQETNKALYDNAKTTRRRFTTTLPIGAARYGGGFGGPGYQPNTDFQYSQGFLHKPVGSQVIATQRKKQSSDDASDSYYKWLETSKNIYNYKGEENTYASLKQICVENLLGYNFSTLNKDKDHKNGQLTETCRSLANFPMDTRSLKPKSRGEIEIEKQPGSKNKMNISQGELDALKADSTGPKSYITFTGGGESLKFSHGISSGVDIKLGFSHAANADWHGSQDVGEDLTILVLNANDNVHKSVDAKDSSSSSIGHGSGSTYAAQVSWKIGDPDLGDKFIIEVCVHVNPWRV
jgi:hypothetical protein